MDDELLDDCCGLLERENVVLESLDIRQTRALRLLHNVNERGPTAAALTAADLPQVIARLVEIPSLKKLRLELPWSDDAFAPVPGRPIAMHSTFDTVHLIFTQASEQNGLNLLHTICRCLSSGASLRVDIRGSAAYQDDDSSDRNTNGESDSDDDVASDADVDRPPAPTVDEDWRLLQDWPEDVVSAMIK